MKRHPSIGQEVPVLLSIAGVGEASPLAIPGEPHDAALRAPVRPKRGQVCEQRSVEEVAVALGEVVRHED